MQKVAQIPFEQYESLKEALLIQSQGKRNEIKINIEKLEAKRKELIGLLSETDNLIADQNTKLAELCAPFANVKIIDLDSAQTVSEPVKKKFTRKGNSRKGSLAYPTDIRGLITGALQAANDYLTPAEIADSLRRKGVNLTGYANPAKSIASILSALYAAKPDVYARKNAGLPGLHGKTMVYTLAAKLVPAIKGPTEDFRSKIIDLISKSSKLLTQEEIIINLLGNANPTYTRQAIVKQNVSDLLEKDDLFESTEILGKRVYAIK